MYLIFHDSNKYNEINYFRRTCLQEFYTNKCLNLNSVQKKIYKTIIWVHKKLKEIHIPFTNCYKFISFAFYTALPMRLNKLLKIL